MSQSGLPFSLPENLNYRVLLEPKGFIRIVEFILAIFAFATCSGYSETGQFSVICQGPPKYVSINLYYPYRLTESISVPKNACETDSTAVHAAIGSEGSSQFFVFVGVWSFLTCLATLVLYVVFDEMSQVVHWIPQVDLIHSAVIVFGWLVGSSAWAQGLTDIKSESNLDSWMKRQPNCINIVDKQEKECAIVNGIDYATLNVSVIFGFLCMAVWFGNLWFLFKETKWFRARQEQQQQNPSGGGPVAPGLPQPQSSSSGSGLPSYPTSSPFAPPSDPTYMQQSSQPQSRI